MGISIGPNGGIVLGGGGDCPCCCDQCCYKFCGNETIRGGSGYTFFAVAQGLSYYIEPTSISLTLGGQAQDGDHPGYCGVEFQFTVKIVDGLTLAECVNVPARMYLCIGDHSAELENCNCVCHWHVDVEGCDGQCDEGAECDWLYDGVNWTKTKDTCGEKCSCLHPDPDGLGDLEPGIYLMGCTSGPVTPPRSFIGGDDCVSAACDGTTCGDCGDFENAHIEVVVPDNRQICCCAELLHAANNEGQI